MKKKRVIILFILSISIFFACNNQPKEYYTMEEVNMHKETTKTDFNNNGIDDYSDIVIGARKDAENLPTYESSYFAGGYPPENIDVCTDLVWRSFAEAGYSLKDMLDNDITNNISKYPRVAGNPDSNIDFRRVPNLLVYFKRNATSLTTDTTKVHQWQPGDIVTYGDRHIGIVSDSRNIDGTPFLLHNAGGSDRESNNINWANEKITGHFRFDSTKIPKNKLIKYKK